MSGQMKSVLARCVIAAMAMVLVFLVGKAGAGNLEPSDDPGPTMHTLDEIYNQIGSQSEKNYNKPIWKIWNKAFWDWPDNDRFAVSVNGYIVGHGPVWGDMVLDKETGLIWARNARMDVQMPWHVVINFIRRVTISNRKGWRMPTAEELSSLLDMSVEGSPKLPPGHPFLNVQDVYWSSTTREDDSSDAWGVDMKTGTTYGWNGKGESMYPWPVRGGNGYATGNW